jgi:NAD(P)-dependent dehydrogenase (short-subunit alcohol dehydrogenase family)/acyl dehydratase/putative sterol carrier protein
MGLFEGKVVIVTGAGGGLGRSHALAFAAEGASVVVNDLGGARDGSGKGNSMADEVVAEIRAAGGTAVANYSSVATVAGGEEIVGTALQQFGRLDVVVNNAGILRDKSFAKMDEAMWDLVMEVHTKQLYAVNKPAWTHMLERGGGGRIINTTSLAGLLGNYGQTNYSAAKAGVAGFTRTLAMEGRKAGITVNAVAPVAKTRMTDDIDMVPSDMKPDHITPMVIYLASDAASDITGRTFGVHGNQMFEYKMTQTPGATKEGLEPWTQDEMTARWADITREEEAGPTASDGTDQVTEAFSCVPAGFKADAASDWKAVMHWVIKGAGNQTLTIQEGSCTHSSGLDGRPTCTVKTDKETVLGMFTGQIDPAKAFMAGKISADNLPDMMKMGAAFDFKSIGAAIAGASGSPTAPPAEKEVLDLRDAIGRRYSADYAMANAADMMMYARATDDLNPRYLENDIVAPPIFPVRLFHPLMFVCCGDPDLDLDMLRLVHGEQDMTWHGPIRPGDLVNLRGVLESVAQKGKGCVVAWRMMGLVDGKVRVEARFSVFVRGQMLPDVAPGTVFGEIPSGGGKPDGKPVMTSVAHADPTYPARYAEASLDDNPIHLDESIAKSAGHPSVILHGLCTMALATRGVVDEYLGGNSARLHRVAVRFSRPVLPGHDLTTRLYEAGTTEEGREAYHLVTTNQNEEVVITNGWVELNP